MTRALRRQLVSGINAAFAGLGHASHRDLSPDDLVIPAGFILREAQALDEHVQ